MFAWILEKQAKIESRPLKLVEVPTPMPSGNEIRLRVQVCGICRTDIHIAEGDLPLKKSPLILGHEAVGVVDAVGSKVKHFKTGDKAGAYWLHSSCRSCKYCQSGQENYCQDIQCTGWDQDGGFAEYLLISEDSALSLNHVQTNLVDLAPLMCPGIAAYAAFKLSGARAGDRLGLYGFGPTACYALQIAQAQGIEVFVSTRSPKSIQKAKELGASWAADSSKEQIPCLLGASIVFPPAGYLVEPALSQLERGGTMVMAPVSASPILIDNYNQNLWGKNIKTLCNLTRRDAEEFVQFCDGLDFQLGVELFDFDQVQEAMIRVRQGKLDQPNAVVRISP